MRLLMLCGVAVQFGASVLQNEAEMLLANLNSADFYIENGLSGGLATSFRLFNMFSAG